MCNSKISAVMAVVAVVLMVATGVAEGQQECVNKLIPCANYINSTSPPATCCNSLREAVEKELTCICNLYNTPGLLEQFRINVTEALLLPGRCGIPGDLSACFAPTSSVPPPPAAVPGNDGNSLRGLAWAGLPTLFLIWASSMVL